MIVSPVGDKSTTTIYVNNVDFIASDWTINELNLAINESNLSNLNISLQGNKEWKMRKFVHIFQSTLGHLRMKDNYEVTISKCNAGERQLDSTLMDMSYSIMTVSDSLLYGLQFQFGQMLLNATNSQIKFKNVEVRETLTSEGLIKVTNDSKLDFENTQFLDNQVLNDDEYSSLTSITMKSSIVVLNSTFVSNKGGCLYSYLYSKISVHNSSFYNNTGYNSGTISSKGENTYIILVNNDFIANVSPYGGADIHVEETIVNINDSRLLVSNVGPAAVLGIGSEIFASS